MVKLLALSHSQQATRGIRIQIKVCLMFLLLTITPLSRAYVHKTIKEQYQIILLGTSHSSLWSCVLCVTGGRFIRRMRCAVEYYLGMTFLRIKGGSNWRWRASKNFSLTIGQYISPSLVTDPYSFSSTFPAITLSL